MSPFGIDGKLATTLLLVIGAQTLAAIWWASGLTTTVNNQGESLKELRLTVTALTSAKVVVLESEVARLQVELATARSLASHANQRRPQ